MSIKLKKGNTFNLTKEEPNLTKIMIGLGWEVAHGGLDLDASIFMVGNNLKIINDNYFIFYNNLRSPDGSTQHTGDNRTGLGEGDDEMILINLSLVDAQVKEIIIVVSIYDHYNKNLTFGLLKEAFIRVYDVERKREVVYYDLDAQFPNDKAIALGKLVRDNNEWTFVAISEGNLEGLQGFVNFYG